jgi:polyisoprenoid-binding protein YceI
MHDVVNLWTVDPARSTVEIAVKHLLVATVRGRFAQFEGCLFSDSEGRLHARGSVRVPSIVTGDQTRDEHLLGPNYFDVDEHPDISFSSTTIEQRDEDTLLIQGDISIKGVTRPIELLAERRASDDGWVGVDVHGELRRSEFGLASPELLEAGVSDKVQLALRVSLTGPARYWPGTSLDVTREEVGAVDRPTGDA